MYDGFQDTSGFYLPHAYSSCVMMYCLYRVTGVCMNSTYVSLHYCHGVCVEGTYVCLNRTYTIKDKIHSRVRARAAWQRVVLLRPYPVSRSMRVVVGAG